MRKKVLGFVFAAVLLVALAIPLFGGGTALAINVQNPDSAPTANATTGLGTAATESDGAARTVGATTITAPSVAPDEIRQNP